MYIEILICTREIKTSYYTFICPVNPGKAQILLERILILEPLTQFINAWDQQKLLLQSFPQVATLTKIYRPSIIPPVVGGYNHILYVLTCVHVSLSKLKYSAVEQTSIHSYITIIAHVNTNDRSFTEIRLKVKTNQSPNKTFAKEAQYLHINKMHLIEQLGKVNCSQFSTVCK